MKQEYNSPPRGSLTEKQNDLWEYMFKHNCHTVEALVNTVMAEFGKAPVDSARNAISILERFIEREIGND